jgi:hypothetical protein
MAWAADQATLGALVVETTYGDTSMTFTSNVAVAANCWTLGPQASTFKRSHPREPRAWLDNSK